MRTKKENRRIYLKYQKFNQKYRQYRRKYEKQYRKENKILWNLKSWKCMMRKRGQRVTALKELNYLLKKVMGS